MKAMKEMEKTTDKMYGYCPSCWKRNKGIVRLSLPPSNNKRKKKCPFCDTRIKPIPEDVESQFWKNEAGRT